MEDDAVHTGILNRRAHVCQYRAHWHHADALHREAVAAGGQGGEAYALYNLGLTARHLGRTDEAVAHHRQSAEPGARHGSPRWRQ